MIFFFFFFTTIFGVFIYFDLSSVFIWFGDYFVSGWLPHCCGPWWLFLGVGLCQLLPSISAMSSSPRSSFYIYTAFAEPTSQLHHAHAFFLLLSLQFLWTVWTFFLLLCRGEYSTSTSVAGVFNTGLASWRCTPIVWAAGIEPELAACGAGMLPLS